MARERGAKKSAHKGKIRRLGHLHLQRRRRHRWMKLLELWDRNFKSDSRERNEEVMLDDKIQHFMEKPVL